MSFLRLPIGFASGVSTCSFASRMYRDFTAFIQRFSTLRKGVGVLEIHFCFSVFYVERTYDVIVQKPFNAVICREPDVGVIFMFTGPEVGHKVLSISSIVARSKNDFFNT
ncbi:hypothetical protein BDQ17DRAFT_1344431 [Cyathus striatus]|nr:hypothetical protein BDQ17DRAFT_1344431 [Cyathus striatus]